MTRPTPDLKPTQSTTSEGSELCGTCQGVAAQTPQALYNRDGLSAIRYRIGEHADFRASVQAALTSSKYAALDALRTRDGTDFTIGLIDAFACAADVLTFYQERIANESYLRTAVERVSLQELGKLIGYRLRPGVAAETWLAFALETPPEPPPALTREPGSFVSGVPSKLALEAGIKVQSVPGPDESPQTFETVERLAEARPSWNAMVPWVSEPRRPAQGATFTYLVGLRNNLKVGDTLLFVGEGQPANPGGGGGSAGGALGGALATATALDSTAAPAPVGGSGTNIDPDFVAPPTASVSPATPTAAMPRAFTTRVLTSVELQPESNRTLVRWQHRLGFIRNTEVHVLRKRAAVFGHSAPDWRSLTARFRQEYSKRQDDLGADWPEEKFTLSPATASDGGFVDLDVTLPEIQADSFVVLTKASDPQLGLFEAVSSTEISRSDFGLSGKVTRLKLRGSGYDAFKKAVRETSVLAASQPLELAEYPTHEAVSGSLVPIALRSDGLLPGRRLIVRGKTEQGEAVAQQVTLREVIAVSDTRSKLEITPALTHSLTRESVVVHGNVALASHGESVSQVLGAGNASAPFQRFALTQRPLTYRAAANELGAKSELLVRVGDVAWSERPALFGALPNERAYALSTDAQGRTFVRFGDGVSGARLPSGVNNVRAHYRKGLGAEGNVGGGKLTQLLTRPLGLKSVDNPLTAQGGTDAERITAARRSVPLTARTLGRVVSLLDYEDFARAFSGIGKAQAQVLDLPAGVSIAITIAGPDGALLTAASPVWRNLLDALQGSGDPHVRVQLLAHQPVTFELGIELALDAGYEREQVLASVESSLCLHYGFESRELSQPVHQSDVLATIHRVAGVVAVDITTLRRSSWSARQGSGPQVRLLAARTRMQRGVALPAELLTLAAGPLRRLQEMP